MSNLCPEAFIARDLLTDVNLSEVSFSGQSGELSLEFLNMSDGGEVGTLWCGGVVTFAYHDYAESSLPVYVGRVSVRDLGAEDACELMRSFGYHVEKQRERLRQRSFQHVCLEGGLMMHIVCERVGLRT